MQFTLKLEKQTKQKQYPSYVEVVTEGWGEGEGEKGGGRGKGEGGKERVVRAQQGCEPWRKERKN